MRIKEDKKDEEEWHNNVRVQKTGKKDNRNV
jgi:hypothetical protein